MIGKSVPRYSILFLQSLIGFIIGKEIAVPNYLSSFNNRCLVWKRIHMLNSCEFKSQHCRME